MAFGTRVVYEEIREVAFGSITSSYTALGSPLTFHARLIIFTNTTNGNVYVSTDGTTNHLKIAPSCFKLLDLTTNRVQDDGLFQAKGTQFYIKSADSLSSGSFWLEVMEGAGAEA